MTQEKRKNGLRAVIKTLERIEDFMAYIGGLFLLFMVFSVCYEIVLRYFFSKPTLWVVGTVEYIMFCVTFLGAAWLLRRNGHVVIDVGLSMFSERGQVTINIITSVVCFVSCAILVWYGMKTTYDLFVRNVMTVQNPEIPKSGLFIFIPAGFFFLAIEFVRKGLDNLDVLKALGAKRKL